MSQHKIQIKSEDKGYRIDKWLKKQYNVPYPLLQKLFRKKDILVNAIVADPTYILAVGDVVCYYGTEFSKKASYQDFSQQTYNELMSEVRKNIIYENEEILIINKPYAIPVQNGSKISISIDTLLCGLCPSSQPKLVHTLDRYTTGILIIAKSKEVAAQLLVLFKEHRIKKQYLAVLDGVPKLSEGVITSKLSKSLVGEQEKVVSSDEGKEAITKFKVLSVSEKDNLSLVSFFPVTGRTHQIRVHACDELRCPVLGDGKYFKQKRNNKMHLHSYKTEFLLNNEKYSFTAPIPEHIKKTLAQNHLKL